ncbi:MAG TPA: 8-amino-7-oxononanoate synthase [Methyloceanibacter sp.]|jgi:8-amino-7-oxononanoate synthase|nr:8-amino-7-oxononanoate synthase [Methyloceanibacter sp.]
MAPSERSYRAFLDSRAREGLRRSLLAVAARDARIIGAEGRSYINFASNDYLGLRFSDALIARSVEWAEAYGVGSGASRLVTGNLDLFAPIEAKVSKLKAKPASLVMASGFQTNAAVLQALFDRTVLGAEPLVFADRLNHASMHFGCQAAGVRQLRYRHCDAAHLAELLSQYQGDDRPKFILTESVFSMDGDVAPVAAIARLAREHRATLIVDDAHATGILGRDGSGLSGEADIVIGTFSKALGSFGGYVACTETVRDYLINRCTGIVYSTALPPPVLGAIDAALDLAPGMDNERAYVAGLSERFRNGAISLRLDAGASTTQIVPVILGSPEAATAMSERLKRAGLWTSAIRPPTVPAGTARLRVAFTAAHEDSDVDRLLEVLASEDTLRPASAV